MSNYPNDFNLISDIDVTYYPKKSIAKAKSIRYIDKDEYDNLQSENKRLREVLERICLDIVPYNELPFNKPMTGKEIQKMNQQNLIRKIIAIKEYAKNALEGGK